MKFTLSPLKTALALLCLSPFTAWADDIDNESFSANTLSEYVIRLNQIPLHDPYSDIALKDNHLNIWEKMRKGFRMDTVSPNTVRKFEDYYSNRPEYFGRITMRATPYLHHILTETEKRNMPSEIALLPFIESAFVIKAKSHAGAMGLWQFMPRTGKQYGLTQNNWYDGRNDIYASTDAALEYLEYLHNMFGDWALALAAYNCGEGCVLNAQRKAQRRGNPTSFDYLTSLPKETREYVPKLLAVRNLVQNPQLFDVQLKKIKNEPYFEAVKINQPIDLKAIAQLAEISEEEVFTLNPGYRVPVWVPQSGRKLLLPKSAIKTFYANLKKANPDDLLSWKPYRVGAVNDVAEIARQHGMSAEELKQINYLRGNTVPRGSILLVSRDEADPVPDSIVRLNNDNDDMSFVSYNDEEYWSEPAYIHAISEGTGKKRTGVRYSTIKIKKGVTLTAVAKRFGTTTAELKRMNRLKSGNLKAGQVIKVPVKSNYVYRKKGGLQKASYSSKKGKVQKTAYANSKKTGKTVKTSNKKTVAAKKTSTPKKRKK
ncbi:MAG: transglycosylase SLT domain-containing protein [Neisseriaceae bacterium]|nr:transglycosylase SLT domain-containing protein [Neisseriaceae bacterium]